MSLTLRSSILACSYLRLYFLRVINDLGFSLAAARTPCLELFTAVWQDAQLVIVHTRLQRLRLLLPRPFLPLIVQLLLQREYSCHLPLHLS